MVLAGCAFEAYLEPQGGEGFQQRTVGGPAITYTDKWVAVWGQGHARGHDGNASVTAAPAELQALLNNLSSWG